MPPDGKLKKKGPAFGSSEDHEPPSASSPKSVSGLPCQAWGKEDKPPYVVVSLWGLSASLELWSQPPIQGARASAVPPTPHWDDLIEPEGSLP